MADSLTKIARDVAAGAVAEVGRWRALQWAAGLVTTIHSPADARDVLLILAAVIAA